MGVHTQSSHKHTEICHHVLVGKKSSKGLNFNNSEEKPHKVLIVESFEEDDEKAQYASFKHILINSCTKLIIDSVHFENINSPWEYALTLTL